MTCFLSPCPNAQINLRQIPYNLEIFLCKNTEYVSESESNCFMGICTGWLSRAQSEKSADFYAAPQKTVRLRFAHEKRVEG